MVIRVQTKRPVFKPSPYETSRRSRRLPSWLILLLIGILIGSAGLLLLQHSYGPKLLSIAESQKLLTELNGLNQDKQRLQNEADDIKRTLESERAENTAVRSAIESDLKSTQEQLAPLKAQLGLLVQTLPYDSRHGPLGISSASFTQSKAGEKLAYTVLLMQDKADRPAFSGFLELAVEGTFVNGRNETIALPAVPVKFGHYLPVSGQGDLPEGFLARRVNVKVMDATGKKPVTWRLMIVQQK